MKLGISIDTFIDYLSHLETPDEMSLNMYKGDTLGAEVRREQLRFYLEAMRENNPSRLFVGEAPGRNGCLQSGVPFTDLYTLYNNQHPSFFNGLKEHLDEVIGEEAMETLRYSPARESTSTIVWERLQNIKITNYPLLWNIYPFHPSTVSSGYLLPADRPNRHPSTEECRLGIQVLEALLDCFDIKQIYAVGRISEKWLKSGFPDVQYIRHPSMGGSSQFKATFNSIFQIEY